MKNKLTYVRFKDIPENEVSGIHKGDRGIIGYECGVSCYEAIKRDGIYNIIMPNSASAGTNYDFEHFIDNLERKEYTCYEIDGDVVGSGSHSEPCLKNIKILNKLHIVNKQIFKIQ